MCCSCFILTHACDACKAILMVITGHVIAELPTVEHCYKIGEYQERCFKAISGGGNRMMWPEARRWCNNQSDGYTLATVRDDTTQEALVKFLLDNELTSSSIWIGARQAVNQRWRWIDGTNESGELSGSMELLIQ